MPLFSNPVLKPFQTATISKHGYPVFPQNLGDSKWQKLLQKWLPTCAPLPAWA